MQYIEIIATPPGHPALLAEREEWVGLPLPCMKETKKSYLVDSVDAIKVLEQFSKKKALVFYTKIAGGPFGFPKKVCRKVKNIANL